MSHCVSGPRTISLYRSESPSAWGVALSPSGDVLYTANGSSNDVSVVDAGSFRVLARIPVGDSPWGAIVVPSPSK